MNTFCIVSNLPEYTISLLPPQHAVHDPRLSSTWLDHKETSDHLQNNGSATRNLFLLKRRTLFQRICYSMMQPYG